MKAMNETYLNCIAIPKTGGTPRKIAIPIDLVSKINGEFKKYPEGVPMVFENGLETILIKALIIGTKDFYKEPFIFMPEGGLKNE